MKTLTENDGRIFVYQRYGGCNYLTMSQLAERFGNVTKQTVRSRIRGLQAEIGKRYSDNVIIQDGKLVLVNQYAYLDYMKNRAMLKDKTARKYLKPYSPAEWARAMGHTAIDVKEIKNEEEKEDAEKN